MTTNTPPFSKINVLLFPSGSMVAKEIYDALKYDRRLSLYGTDFDYNNFSAYYFENYISGCPMIEKEEETLEFMSRLVREYHIKYIFPAFDKVIPFLKRHESRIGAVIMAPDLEVINVCNSKLLTYQLLSQVIPTPKMYSKTDTDLHYPLYSKPIVGYGTHGHFLIHNDQELQSVDTDCNVILEYLTGDEFTVDCFSSRQGQLLYCHARQRIRTLNGMSIHSQLVNLEGINDYALLIQSKIKMVGLWFFQVKYDQNGLLKLLEIACRVPGAMCVNRVRGVNFPLLSILDAEGSPIDPIIYNEIDVSCFKIYHNHYKTNLTYRHVYCDLDDTLIINNRINLQLVTFLYQCLDQNIGLSLITRNSHPEFVLTRYRIHCFDEVIVVSKNKQDDPKSSYIRIPNSIFIDDSHQERLDVLTKCQIPCFSPAEVELLLN